MQTLAPLILQQDTPALQRTVAAGRFSYVELVLFYPYRIRLYENDPRHYLNALIALNPGAIGDARQRDRQRLGGAVQDTVFTVFGMLNLLKDNLGAGEIPMLPCATLDTPGPLAMSLFSTAASLDLATVSLPGVRLGYFSHLLDTPLYAQAVGRMRQQGAVTQQQQCGVCRRAATTTGAS